jgi:hypothetical protein
MSNKNKWFSGLAAVFLAGVSIALTASAQDIEILGKNGERVELTPKLNAGQAATPNRLSSPHLLDLRGLEGRKIIAKNVDGDSREISIDDARRISVNRSFSSSNVNGNRSVQQKEIATIVAADGETYTVDLSQISDEGEVTGEPKPIAAKRIEVPKSYWIGVGCQPIPEMLRAQLNLDQNVGLLVHQVMQGSPAETAGIERHDILLYADDQVLTKLEELVDVVNETGSQQQPISFTVMRGGKETAIAVTPEQRQAGASALLDRMPLRGLQLNDFGPGLIFDKQMFNGDMDKAREAMEKARENMEEVHREMKRMQRFLGEDHFPIPALPNIEK